MSDTTEAETIFENGAAAVEAPVAKKRVRKAAPKVAKKKAAPVEVPVKRRGRPPGSKNKEAVANGAGRPKKAGIGNVLAATSKLKAEDHVLFNKFAGALETLKPVVRQRLAEAVYRLFGK